MTVWFPSQMGFPRHFFSLLPRFTFSPSDIDIDFLFRISTYKNKISPYSNAVEGFFQVPRYALLGEKFNGCVLGNCG